MPDEQNPDDGTSALEDGGTIIQDDTLEPDQDEAEETSEESTEGEAPAESQPEGTPQEATPAEDTTDWKAKAEKAERIARHHQSRADRVEAMFAPHAPMIAEKVRADQEKAQRLAGDRDALLREFATNPQEVIQLMVRNEMQNARSAEQLAQIEVQARQAYSDCIEYAAERGLDENAVQAVLNNYNFNGMPPQQALNLAKVVIDKAAAPQIAQQQVQQMVTEADKQTKQKLIKKTPVGVSGGAMKGREKSLEDVQWERAKTGGSPLKNFH